LFVKEPVVQLINLKHRDLTNMRVAKYLNAPTLLVVDIDRVVRLPMWWEHWSTEPDEEP